MKEYKKCTTCKVIGLDHNKCGHDYLEWQANETLQSYADDFARELLEWMHEKKYTNDISMSRKGWSVEDIEKETYTDFVTHDQLLNQFKQFAKH